jgi:hypothetical protein
MTILEASESEGAETAKTPVVLSWRDDFVPRIAPTPASVVKIVNNPA